MRHCAKDIRKNGCHGNEISPRPLEWISQNEAQLSSHLSKSTGILEPNFGNMSCCCPLCFLEIFVGVQDLDGGTKS